MFIPSNLVYNTSVNQFQEPLNIVKQSIEKGQIVGPIIPLNFDKKQVRGLVAAVKFYLLDQKKNEAAPLIFAEIAKELFSDRKKAKEFAWDPENQKNFPELIIAIAKLAAQQNGWGTSEEIKKYGIKDEKELIAIAKLAAQQDGWGTSRYIQNYGIKDEKELIAIAKLAAQQNGWGTSYYIQNYGMKNEKELIAIAKLAAQQHGGKTSEYIREYGIKDEKELIAIAKLAAQQDGWGTSEEIRRYGIKDEKELIAIAKLAAQQNGWRTSEEIKNYGIKDEKELIAIAKLAAQQNGGKTSEYIQKYGITDEKELIAIAKLAAQQDGGETSRFIQNYGIKDEKGLIAIAKLAAQQHGKGTSFLIKNYGIKDEKELIAIAKLAAQQDGRGTSINIHKYGIKNEKELIAIAKLAAQQDGRGTSEYIPNYGITDPSYRCEILGTALAQSPEALDYVDWYNLPADWPSYTKHWSKLDFSELSKQIDNGSDPRIKQSLSLWLKYTLSLCKNEGLKEEEMSWLVKQPLLSNIFDYRDPKMRFTLSKYLALLVKDKESREHFEKNSKNASKNVLPNMLVSLLDVQAFTFVKLPAFKDKLKMKTLINTLATLLDQSSLEAEDKKYIFEQSIKNVDADRAIKNWNAILGIIHSKGVAKLKKEHLQKKDNNFEQVFRECAKELIPFGNSENFATKFTSSFGKFRNPYAVYAYAAGLSTLPEKESLLQLLANFFTSVLENSFHNERYNRDSNIHLKTVFEGREALEKEWKNGASFPLSDFVNASKNEEQVVQPSDFKKILQEKILTDRHLDPEKYPHLKDFLNGIIDPNKFLLNLSQDKEIKDKKSDHFKIQQECIRLCIQGKENQALESLEKLLQKLQPVPEFVNDILGFRKLLNQKSATLGNNKYEDYTIVDTNDSEDLLMCGTDVNGSCQRIGGDPGHNKGLLSYLMDGKNRMIAIKDKQGTIVARAIFRILFDDIKKHPVLFIERVYPSMLDKNLENALMGMAKKRAEALQLPLFCKSGTEQENKTCKIVSLGGPAPFEYVDAIGGLHPKSHYTIISARDVVPESLDSLEKNKKNY